MENVQKYEKCKCTIYLKPIYHKPFNSLFSPREIETLTPKTTMMKQSKKTAKIKVVKEARLHRRKEADGIIKSIYGVSINDVVDNNHLFWPNATKW